MIEESVAVVPMMRPLCLLPEEGVDAVRTVQRVRVQMELRRTCVPRSRRLASS